VSEDSPPLRQVLGTGRQPVPVPLEDLMSRVARGDQPAFEQLYRRVASPVLGIMRRVLRDSAQSEEVTQEVLVDVWRTASRFDESRGSAMSWVMTMAHRRAVDRVRSEQSASEREKRVGRRNVEPSYDSVVEVVETRLE
jgi:RNA polymerase sigma-70 factor (ECF subfamily)